MYVIAELPAMTSCRPRLVVVVVDIRSSLEFRI